jgi:hypothetical protein
MKSPLPAGHIFAIDGNVVSWDAVTRTLELHGGQDPDPGVGRARHGSVSGYGDGHWMATTVLIRDNGRAWYPRVLPPPPIGLGGYCIEGYRTIIRPTYCHRSPVVLRSAAMSAQIERAVRSRC